MKCVVIFSAFLLKAHAWYKTPVYFCCKMKHLASTIETIFRVDSRGGKLIERDSNVIMLYDYPRISHDAIQIITDQFPSVVVNTMSCSSSSSGFIVMFTLPDRESIFLTSVFFQMITLIVIACLTYYFSLGACLLNVN